MRFLLGIIIGGILTLFVATAMDAPTHPILDRAQGTLLQIWDRLISSTSDSLFDDAEAQAPDVESLLEDLQQLKRLPDTALSPATALRAPAAVDAPPPADVVRDPLPTGTVATVEPTKRLDEHSDALAEFWPESALAFDGHAAEAEPVWEPFHSHMSAEGFAARLSRELEHEFRVERQAAGAYQVVFNTADPREREALLAQISEITGQ